MTYANFIESLREDRGFRLPEWHRESQRLFESRQQVQESSDKDGGRWITIHPHGEDHKGIHIRIDSEGYISGGPRALKERGIHHISDFGNAKDKDVEAMKPHALSFLLDQHNEREAAKSEARKYTKLNAGNLAKYENAYKDLTARKGFDTAARNFANENRHFGYDPEAHDTPQKVWDLIREGSKKPPTLNDRAVHTLATEWAKPQNKTPKFAFDSDWDEAPAEPVAKQPEKFVPPSVPGQQKGLFNEEPSGQKKLFDIVQSPKAKSKPKEPELSTLEKIGDEQKKREAESKPLAGQKNLLSGGRNGHGDHAIDPLDIGTHNVDEVLRNQQQDILSRDRKLSPAAANALAAARVMNAINARGKKYIEEIDNRVKRGGNITDAEDERYIHAGEQRRRLYPTIVQKTGYRPMGEVDTHPEAMQPLVGPHMSLRLKGAS